MSFAPTLRLGQALIASIVVHVTLVGFAILRWPEHQPPQMFQELTVRLIPNATAPSQSAKDQSKEFATERHARVATHPADVAPYARNATDIAASTASAQLDRHIDLEAAREAARAFAREDSRNPAPNRVTLGAGEAEPLPGPMARAITRSITANCREKYAGLGLLGLPLLLKDSVSDGCVW